jgi:endo-1,4-beta-xylanase
MKMNRFSVLLLCACSSLSAQHTLKDAYEGKFRIGVALNEAQFSGRDASGAALAAAQFNAITPENVLKWEIVHPKPGVYNFEPSDKYVAFGEKYGMQIIGHTLVWHSQVPKWVFEDEAGKPLTREALLARMKDHIDHVVGRYKGRIEGWDVVNEAFDEDGTLRKSPWMTIVGEDYIAKAFEYAHEADPAAKLHYNDYNMAVDAKRAGVIEMIRKLRGKGIQVDVAGEQGHLKLERPSVEQYDRTITELASAGVKVAITELDIDLLPAANRNTTADVSRRDQARAELNPYPNGLPKEVQEKLAKRYADLFAVFLKHKDVIQRVTLWGLSNGDSWLNNWPVRGRTSYPLLFDAERRTTPAFDAVVSLGLANAPK